MTTPMNEQIESVLRDMTAAPDQPPELWRKALRGAPTKAKWRWSSALAASMIHRPMATAAVLVIGIGALIGAGAVITDRLPVDSRRNPNRHEKASWLTQGNSMRGSELLVDAQVGRDFLGYDLRVNTNLWDAIRRSNTTPKQFVCPSTTRDAINQLNVDLSAFSADEGSYSINTDAAWDRPGPWDPSVFANIRGIGQAMHANGADGAEVIPRTGLIENDISGFESGDRILVSPIDEYKSNADPTRKNPSHAYFDSDQSHGTSAASVISTGESQSRSTNRHVISRATIQIKTTDVRGAFLKAQHLLQLGHGEYVETSGIRGENENATAEITLRVAAGRLSEVLNALRELGEVQVENLSGEDVTMQVVDIEARLRNEQRVEAEVLKLLESRQDAPLDEILKLRQSLGEIRTRIEEMTGRREQLARLVSLSTILVLIRAGDAPNPEPASLWTDFGKSMSAAWHNGLAYLGSIIATILNVLVGGLVFWVALIAVIWYARRRLLRRPDSGG